MFRPISLRNEDTIAARATSLDGAARGIVRVTGPDTAQSVGAVFIPADDTANSDWRAAKQSAVWPGSLRLGEPLGAVPVLLYWWPGRASYTRQPTAELHLFGSPALLDATLDALRNAGARPAEPGEFTLRAFLAGRLDLPQAEAVLGVIDAHSRTELDVALAQLAGGLGRPLTRLRDQLLESLAHLEAGLDFVEEDIEFITDSELSRTIRAAEHELREIMQRLERRGESRSEPRVVLRGLPNVGKSSLLNALTDTAAALVADEPGTTRDYLVRTVTWEGRRLQLIDTAGVEDEERLGGISAQARSLATQQSEQAQLELFCLDASRPLEPWEQAELLRRTPRRQIVWTKIDRLDVTRAERGHQWRLQLLAHAQGSAVESPLETDAINHLCDAIMAAPAISSHTGAGLDRLRQTIQQNLASSESDETGVVAGTAVRCRDALRQAVEALERAGQLVERQDAAELVAAELRDTLDALGQMVGAVYTDDLLDQIFSRFCIGK